jgi:hypothetical protein
MPLSALRFSGPRRAFTRTLAGKVGTTLVLLATGLSPQFSRFAQAAPKPAAATPPTVGNRIAVLPLEIIGDVPAGRPALEAAVAKGLVIAGVPVTIGPEVGTALNAGGARVACVDPACWVAAGRALGARHLIAGVVERKGPVFQVEFRLVDAATGQGREVMKEANHCDVADCSVAELCRLTVHELARAGLSRPSAPVAAPTPAPAAPSAVPAAAATGASEVAGAGPATPPAAGAAVATDGTHRYPSEKGGSATSDLSGWTQTPDAGTPATARRFPAWVPIAAIAGGVVAGAVGGYLLYRDDDCTTEVKQGFGCPENYRTYWPGMATVAGGAILFATGVVLSLTNTSGSSSANDSATPATPAVTGVSIGPASLGLHGRF